MIKSIQQFQSDGVKKLDKVFGDYSTYMTKIAEMLQGTATLDGEEFSCPK